MMTQHLFSTSSFSSSSFPLSLLSNSSQQLRFRHRHGRPHPRCHAHQRPRPRRESRGLRRSRAQGRPPGRRCRHPRVGQERRRRGVRRVRLQRRGGSHAQLAQPPVRGGEDLGRGLSFFFLSRSWFVSKIRKKERKNKKSEVFSITENVKRKSEQSRFREIKN